MKKIVPIVAGLAICVALLAAFRFSAVTSGKPKAATANRIVLCTTFPIHQITRHVTLDCPGLESVLLLSSQMGCPHDYALTPQDMQKLAKAQCLVINGLGMESFLGAPLKSANPAIHVVDSSKGVEDLIQETREEGEAVCECCKHSHVNPHLFASPRMAAKLSITIAEGLAAFSPEHAELFRANAKHYAIRLNTLADEMSKACAALKNRRIVQPHGVFDYLARDLGLEILAVMQSHGQEPSASEMLDLAKILKEKHAGAIFCEPQYGTKVGESLSRETGVPFLLVDPVATGPDNAPLDHFESVMRLNLKKMLQSMGPK